MLIKPTIPFAVLWLACVVSSGGALTFLNMSTSYAEFKHWEANKKSRLQFRFKTHNSLGLLFYMDDSEAGGRAANYLLLELRHGTLRLSIQMGSEDYKSSRKLQLGADLNDLLWHQVTVKRDGRKTSLAVDGVEKQTETNGEHSNLDVNSNLYFGGIPPAKIRQAVNQAATSLPRFVGCIENVTYSSGQDPPVPAVIVTAVGLEKGCVDKCKQQTCANRGACYNWFNNIHCDCAGTGYEGLNCTRPSVSVYLRGYNYISWNVVGMYSSRSGRTTIRFRTYIASGLLFAVSKDRDFMTVELHDGKVYFAINLGGGTLTLSVGNGNLDDKEWHTLDIRRSNRDLSVALDHIHVKNGTTPGPHSIFNIDGGMVYIGGHMNPSLVRESRSKAQFAGCLQHVFYNGIDILYKALYTQSLFVHLYGNIQEGCPLVRPSSAPLSVAPTRSLTRVKVPRHNATAKNSTEEDSKKGSNIWKLDEYFIDIKDDNPDPPMGKTLSDSAIAGITVGIIVGGLFFAASSICLIHQFKLRYSGVFRTMQRKGSSPASPVETYKAMNGEITVAYDVGSRRDKGAPTVTFRL